MNDAVSLPLTYATDEALLFATPRSGRPLVLLAGHLDTVPEQGNLPGRIEDGWVAGPGRQRHEGRRGGDDRARELGRGRPCPGARPRLSLLRSRGAARRTRAPCPASSPKRRSCSNRISSSCSSRPTAQIHAGCLGNLNATLVFRGESAHSARPWQGVNAIAIAVEGLGPVVAVPPLEVEVGGLTFVEVLSATQIHGGVADNVVPDSVEVRLNYRYAPNRTQEEAAAPAARARRRRRRDHRQLPARARRRRVPARPQPARRGRPRGRAEAGLDAGRRVRGAGARRGQLRPRRHPLRAPPRRAGRDRGPRTLLRGAARVCERLAFGRAALARPVRPGDVSIRPDRARQARSCRGGHRDPRLRAGRPARADRPGDPPGARRRARGADGLSEGGGPPRAARGDRRAGSSDGSGSRSTRTAEVIPTYGSKEAIFSFAQVAVDPSSAEGHGRRDGSGLPRAGQGRGVRGRAGRVAAAARGERLPPRPRGRRGLGADRALLGQLPEQPDGRDRDAVLLRAAGRARARARLPALLRRGLQRALVHASRRVPHSRSPTVRTSSSSRRSRSAPR